MYEANKWQAYGIGILIGIDLNLESKGNTCSANKCIVTV
jgi:hypothetical protein